MWIFKDHDKSLDFLYIAINKDGRINTLIYDCYEYGKLTPKEGKTNTFKRLKELSKRNRKDLHEVINKRKRKIILN